jgi:hypothetical protein
VDITGVTPQHYEKRYAITTRRPRLVTVGPSVIRYCCANWRPFKGVVITLSGTVDSCIKKHAVEAAAQRVRGVNFVALDMEVSLEEKQKQMTPV